jgi:hypothetical protein
MSTPVTPRDAAAVQRLWQSRVLSDDGVDRALADLVAVVDQRDDAARIVARLAAIWPKEALRAAEAWLERNRPATFGK